MILKLTFGIFFTFLIPYEADGETLSCSYTTINNQGYSCNLSVIFFYDPSFNGNFYEINGDHVHGASDDNVTILENSLDFNAFIFPKIICEKFNKLQKIEFKDSRIGIIPAGSFEKCENLESVQIFNSWLKRLDDELLKNCEFLRVLTFEDSKVRHIPENMLASCKNLRKLELSGNELKNFNENLLKNQENLEVLNLSRNKIEGFPKNFFRSLKRLQKLNLSNNSIAVLSINWFKDLGDLTDLNLSNNQIQAIPKSFIKLQVHLQTLDLSSNQLTSIHADSFYAYPSIIILSQNGITGIEERFVKNILKANKTLKIQKTICTKDYRNNFGYKLPENQTSGQLLEYLDNCFNQYEGRNEDEGSFAESNDNFKLLNMMRDELVDLLTKLSKN